MQNLLSIPFEEAHFLAENIAKIYPSEIKLFQYNKPMLIRKPGLEPQQLRTSHITVSRDNVSNIDFARSIRRTRTVISDIVVCNDFEFFTTFTFKNDRQDMDKCRARMQKWLSNQKALHGNFQYLIVPEFHKDKKSLHFHALIKNYKGKLVDSGKTHKGRKIYNIASYRLGFSTAVPIDHSGKVSSYIRKYITKDMPTFANKKRYWCSTGLVRPHLEYNHNIDDGFEKTHSTDMFDAYVKKV